MAKPLFAVQDLPVVGPIIGLFTRRQEEEEAARKLREGEPLTPRDVGLILSHGIRQGRFTSKDIPAELKPYLPLAFLPSGSRFGTAVADVLHRAADALTGGVLEKFAPQARAAPESAIATGIAGTLAGTAATAAPLARLAGTGGLLSRMARMGAVGTATGATKGVLGEEETIPAALREGALFALGEAAVSPLNRLLRLTGITRPIAAMPEELAQTLATRARRTGPLPSEVTPRPTASGGGISAARGVADALRKREEAAQRALAESLENLVETLTPRAQTDPAAEAIERLIKSLEVRAGTAPKVRPAVPPAREAALEALPRPHVPGAARAPRGLPPGKALPAPFGPTAQEIADLAELKRMAYSKLHEAMVNEIRPSAMRAWEAAGRPQGKLEEFVRAEAAARGYDYDRIMAELDKPLEEHARDIEELVRLGSTAGVVPEVRSVEDVYRILSSVVEGRPSSGAAAAAAEVAPAIEVAPGYSGRAPEVEELIRRILRSGGGKVLARGVEVGPPEMPIARPKVIIPAAERVPKEPPKVAAVTRLPKRAKRSGGDRKGR